MERRRPMDVTPHVDDFRWEVTPDSLMAIAETHWAALEPALKQLEAEYFGHVGLDPSVMVRRLSHDD